MAVPKLRRQQDNTSMFGSSGSLSKRGYRSSPSSVSSSPQTRKYAKSFLFLALFWPLLLPAIFYTFTQDVEKIKEMNLATVKERMNRLLTSSDLTGYGPRYPRLVVLVTGENAQALRSAVENVFQHTDRNRILTVVAVLDGVKETFDMKEQFEGMDQGNVPHWHGIHYHPGSHSTNIKTHEENADKTNTDELEEDEETHGKKIHVIFNEQKVGVSKCRQMGAMYAKELAEKYEKAKLKLKEEELILVLMRQDARLADSHWLDPLTASLILPELSQKLYKTHLANAISFAPLDSSINTDPAFDLAFHPSSFPLPKEENLSYSADKDDFEFNNKSTPPFTTPALHGPITAMRLTTYLSLPARDTLLTTHFAADVELALNLWLCADGIDVVPQIHMELDSYAALSPESEEMSDLLASRLASAWMNDAYQSKFYNARTSHKDSFVSQKELESYVNVAKESPTFPINLPTRCRSFDWYMQHVVGPMLATPEKAQAPQKSPQKRGGVIKAMTRIKGGKEPERPEQKQTPHPVHPEHDPRLPHIPGLPEEPKKTPSRQLTTLSEDKLEILDKATAIDITYVDAHTDVSHYVALDENGNEGYLHDPTALHLENPSFEPSNGACRNKRDANYRMLTEKVFVDMKKHKLVEETKKDRVKLFCTVYTIEKNHNRVPMIRETWGKKCDGFMVVSTKTVPELNIVNIPHEGPEEYNNIWQKTRANWAYIYDNYYNDYDWFHIGGDDLYVLVENLRLYLESPEIQLAVKGGRADHKLPEGMEVPMFMGRRFAEQGNMERIFNSGGSGYTINKAALKTLVVKAFPHCFPHMKTFAEDVMVATCLRNQGVFPYETKDEQGGERYMPFQPAHHLTYKIPADKNSDWYPKYSINIKEGLDHCAARSVAFHYIQTDLMERMHAILYGHCK